MVWDRKTGDALQRAHADIADLKRQLARALGSGKAMKGDLEERGRAARMRASGDQALLMGSVSPEKILPQLADLLRGKLGAEDLAEVSKLLDGWARDSAEKDAALAWWCLYGHEQQDRSY